MKNIKPLTVVLVLVLLFGKGFPAFGWDNPGHMAVAGLAFDELSPGQKTRLAAILRKHQLLSFITEGFPEGFIDNHDRELVMAAATWPDLARGHVKTKKSPNKEITNNGYQESDPAVTQVQADGLLHPGWHFIDTPLWVGDGPDPGNLPPAPEVNAVGVVNVLVKQLKFSEADPAKAYDLGWLLHLVGDLHQPLHAVNGISETLPKGDRGGNEVQLQGETNGEHELHAFWDDILGKKASDTKGHPRLDKDVATADEIISEASGVALGIAQDDLDPSHWASESFQIAKRDAYDLHLKEVSVERPKTNDPENVLEATLDADYGATAKKDARKQIRLAGHRLAQLLKEILH